MSKSSRFKKAGDLSLINGGYLSNADGDAVTHPGFVAAQDRAHLLVTVADAMKGKTFNPEMPDCLQAIINNCSREINNAQSTVYVKAPKAPTRKIQEQLEAEAQEWIDHQDDLAFNEELNNFLQDFNVIQEFEDFGLFFSAGVVKLNEIYSMKQIIKAAKTVLPVLHTTGAVL